MGSESRAGDATGHGPDLAMHSSLFDLIRDPILWGQLPPAKSKIIEATIEDYRRRLQSLGVFSRLDESQGLPEIGPQMQRELASLVADIDERYEQWRASGTYFDELKARSNRAPGQVRKLGRKLARVQKEIEAIAADALKVDPFVGDLLLPSLTRAVEAVHSANARLAPGGQSTTKYAERLASGFQEVSVTHPQPYEPRRDAASRLVRYLRREASLKHTDALVRAARIGNHLWGWDYKIQANDFDVLDCPGLRMLIGRAAVSDAVIKTAGHAPATAKRGRSPRQRTRTKKPRE